MSSVLSSLPLFAGLAPADLARVEQLTHLWELEPGQVICRRGDPGTDLYIVVAGAIDVKLGDVRLVTSTPGVLRNVDDPSSRLTRITVAEAKQAIVDKVVTGGMIAKLEEAMAVIDQGVGSIHILGKLAAGDLVRAVREPGSVGTTLVA